jgi:alpha-galactosidase
MHIYTEEFSALDLDFRLEVSLPEEAPAVVEVNPQPDPSDPTGTRSPFGDAEGRGGFPETSYLKIKVSQAGARQSQSPVKGSLKLTWSVPIAEMHGMITFPPSQAEMGMLPMGCQKKLTWAASSLPFLVLIHRNGDNHFACGLLDQLTETEIAFEQVLPEGSYAFTLEKPFVLQNGVWQEIIMLSARRIPWQETLKEYREFVDRAWPQPGLPVPESAYEPIFCTWYAVLHDITQDWVLDNAYLASRLGFKTWITDDGWFLDQTSDTGSGEFAGDWQPSVQRFPDFADHVAQVQKMGLRYLLWVAPAMVGKESQAAREHADLLQQPAGMPFFCLSPWKTQSGEIIAGHLERLLKDYHLDGFKLDFIDTLDPRQVPPDPDFQTAGEGIYHLLSQALERLPAIRPDVLVEFRNPYTNLAGRRFGNLYRASDTPFNAANNRWQVAMLRLLAPDRAVVLDPVCWGQDASLEDVAVMLINALCGVPMVSVDLGACQHDHLNVLRHWIEFYNKHRSTLVHGEFLPEFHHNALPLIRFIGEKERILALYEDYPLTLDMHEGDNMWVLNASTRPYIDILPDKSEGSSPVTAWDKFGNAVYTKIVTFPVSRLDVPVGGSLEIAEIWKGEKRVPKAAPKEEAPKEPEKKNKRKRTAGKRR